MVPSQASRGYRQDQAIEIDALDQIAGFGGICRGGDAKPARSEIALQKRAQPLIVIDDQEMGVIACVHGQESQDATRA